MSRGAGGSVARAADWALGLSALGWALRAVIVGQALTPVGGTIAALNAAVGVLFVLRRPAQTWASPLGCALVLGSVLSSGLALRVAPPPPSWPVAATAVFVAGGAGALISLAALGKSFGVLPAVRGIVRRGPFGLVRHPAYAAELVMVLACSGAAGTVVGLWPAGLAAALVVVRIRIEEQLLGRLPEYRGYAAQVRWRLLPGVW